MKVHDYEWADRKVLVTGASGFKGSWLCAALRRLGARIYGTVRNQRDPLSSYEILNLEDDVVNVRADISDRQQTLDLLNSVEPDVIFHLAAKALVPVALRDPRRAFEVNIMGTLNVVESCRMLQICNRLVIASTDHVFGDIEPHELPEGGFNERSRLSYGGPYDTSKAAMELVVRATHRTYWHQLPAIGVTRCANVFGYGDTNQRRIIPLFVRSAVTTGSIPLRYRFSGRQFLHVTDAIAGYIMTASCMEEGGRGKGPETRPDSRTPFTPTYHFATASYPGSNKPYITMEALARLVAGICGAKVDDSKCVDYPPNENRLQAINCDATRNALGWRPMKSFPDELSGLAEWYRSGDDHARLRGLIHSDLDELIAAIT